MRNDYQNRKGLTPWATPPELRGLLKLDALDVFKPALKKSDKTASQTGKVMGRDSGQVRRLFSTHWYYPGFEHLLTLCAVLNSTLILQWLQIHAMHYGLQPAQGDLNCARLVSRENP